MHAKDKYRERNARRRIKASVRYYVSVRYPSACGETTQETTPTNQRRAQEDFSRLSKRSGVIEVILWDRATGKRIMTNKQETKEK